MKPKKDLVIFAIEAVIVACFLIVLCWSLVGCKTTKTATKATTDSVAVKKLDSVAVSKKDEVVAEKDEYVKITERYLPGDGWYNYLADSFLSPKPFINTQNYEEGWKPIPDAPIQRQFHLVTGSWTDVKRPPVLFERIIERGTKEKQTVRSEYDSTDYNAVDTTAKKVVETVNTKVKTGTPWWLLPLAIAVGAAIILIVVGYGRKRKRNEDIS
jgi:hypothetical protein